MDLQRRTKHFCWYVLLVACLFRLTLARVPQTLARRLSDFSPSFPIYSETGRNVRFLSSSEGLRLHSRESPPPQLPEVENPEFEPEDAALVEMDYDCDLRPDLEALVAQPLSWNLRSSEPAVLILHTHTTESYSGTQMEGTQYRTLDESCNMLSVGDAVARILEEAGIGVIHDRQVHDYPSYSGSYVHARKTVQELLEQNPSVQLVLDLHRDALEAEGKQIRPVVYSGSETAAQMMLVVGTDVSRPTHSRWQENLSLALKLHARLEKICPGIMRPLNLRSERFNQDLHPGALLVEIGAAGNSHGEALAAARILAEAVTALAGGTINRDA